MNYIWESLIILFTGFCLLRIAGKKTIGEMSGLEIITTLAIASTTGHAISETGLIKTILALCTLVTLLIFIQFLTTKSKSVERLFIGKPIPVIQEGKVITNNLKKLRMTVEQLEAKLHENGILSITDVKNASIEITGQLGYELMKHAKPVTVGELEQILKEQLPTLFQQFVANDRNPLNESVQDVNFKKPPEI